jgi:acyl-CoA synthetase (AMP-forming)/AMP-acid ligase II
MFTSGTTGTPKGAMLSEKNILANVKDICSYLEIKDTDSFLITRPLYHAAVLNGEFLTAIFKGASVRFYSDNFQPAAVLSLIERFEATVFCGTPTLLSLMTRFCRKSTSLPLKTICVSGECMSAEVGNRIAASFPEAKIYHIYGLTEASPRVSYLPPEHFQSHPNCVGIPLPSVELKILKTDGNVAAKNEEGVLYVKGPNVMLGYYNDKKATDRVLRKGWLCTGDIAILTEEGFLRIKGRGDDMIIRAGMNIYPQEIEGRMKADERVKEILVYPFENPTLGVGIGMKLVGDFNSIEEVKRLCSELLPTYEIPNRIELVAELSHNGSGKLKRKQ